MAVVLREVEHSDFDQILSLFVEVYGKQPFEGFKKAFFNHNLFLGNCLIDDEGSQEVMVGYFGCFTYHRILNNQNVKFYNSHTWIVKEAYRKQSLKLLMPYVRLKDGIVTNFSANGKVAQILEQLKFTKLTVKNAIVKTSFNLKSIIGQRKIKSLQLTSDILKSHDPYVGLCLNLQISNQDTTLKLILKPVNRKPRWALRINKISKAMMRKPLVTNSFFLFKVHYTNNSELLLEHVDALSHYLFLKEKVGGLIVSQSVIENLPLNRIRDTYEDTIYVKTNQHSVSSLDYLFSEVFYLNIKDK